MPLLSRKLANLNTRNNLSGTMSANADASRKEMILFALGWGGVAAVAVYLLDVYVYPLINGPISEEWSRPITTSIVFGVFTFVGVLFWAGVGTYLDEHFPKLREHPNKKKAVLVALTLGVTGTVLLYLLDTVALPLIGGDPLSPDWKQPVITWILIGTLLFNVALYWKGARRVVEERLSGFRGDRS
jgi:hypothetical protein